jgi:predicted TIM-barrel fold metal-dependent hydrolase
LIDAYSHIFPPGYMEAVRAIARDQGRLKRWFNLRALHDLDTRFETMDRFPGYQQVLTLSMPPIEALAGPEESPRLARLANDSMAALCATYPDRFPAFVAGLPLDSVPAALIELDRAVTQLGARGIQLFSNVNGIALDDPRFRPLFERMADLDLPIWIHPTRGPSFADYATERDSRFEIWWALGWPYETSVAMARLVFSGLFRDFPSLKIITHHMGAMIPYFEGRIVRGWDQLGSRTEGDDLARLRAGMEKSPVEYFRMFYADTALSGSRAGTRCGLDFFGAEHCLFGTDYPFDPEGGELFIRETIATVDSLGLPEEQKSQVLSGNVARLMRLPASRGNDSGEE